MRRTRQTDTFESVEHACYKCGAVVQEGMAFCPNCNAPQIRVNMPEQSSPSFEPGTPGEMQPPAQPVYLSPTPPLSPTAIDWTAGWPAVITAGILSGICFFLPLNIVWVVGGGVLAVWIYSRRKPGYMQIASGTGAKLGAVTGLIGYALFALVVGIGFAFASDKIWAQLALAMKERAGATPEASVQQVLQLMNSSEGRTFIATFVMIFAFVLFLLLAALGGLVGAALVKRNPNR